MSEEVALKVENLDKVYRLGEIGTGTISHDLNRWWAKVRGKEDPFAKVGVTNDRTQKAEKGEYVKVLNNINFEVKKGEVLGIIGKNGAGKSTLLKVISQITSPSSGSIKAKGRIASLLEVGTGMHPEMTGKENIYLNGTILGMTRKEIDAKYDEIMEFAGCAKYADTPVKRYSSGMKVRLGFAVAAFLEPEILIVDEVLAVGDAEFQRKAIGKMQEISEGGGRTVLFVSHNMGSISNLCTRCLVLEKGKVSFEGNTKEAIEKYSSTSTFKSQYKLEEQKKGTYIKCFSIGTNQKAAKDEVLYDEEIRLSWTIILDTRKDLLLGFHIKNSQDVMILADTFEIPENEMGHEVQVSYCLPKKFLMPGHFVVNTAIQIPHKVVFDMVEGLVGFSIVDTGTHLSQFGNSKVIVSSPGTWTFD